jgi:hypothetical protein
MMHGLRTKHMHTLQSMHMDTCFISPRYIFIVPLLELCLTTYEYGHRVQSFFFFSSGYIWAIFLKKIGNGNLKCQNSKHS